MGLIKNWWYLGQPLKIKTEDGEYEGYISNMSEKTDDIVIRLVKRNTVSKEEYDNVVQELKKLKSNSKQAKDWIRFL